MLPLFTGKNDLWLYVNYNGIYHYDLSAKKLEEIPGYRNTEQQKALLISRQIQQGIYILVIQGV
jgi:hypothetical protein